MMHTKLARTGPRRFQWQTGEWFGGVVGGSAWLVPTAAVLAVHGQPVLALVPASCGLLTNFVGGVLWYRRDRVRPFPALLIILALFSVVTPLVWFMVSLHAAPESLAALRWPQRGIAAVMATLICPAIIGWLCVLEYSHRKTSTVHTNSLEG